MSQSLGNEQKTFIELDTSDLSSAQVRVIKTLNHMLAHALSTKEEGEYFEGSAEILRICASLIKQANFLRERECDSIAYEEQVLEFSLDVLQEHMDQSKVVRYDC